MLGENIGNKSYVIERTNKKNNQNQRMRCGLRMGSAEQEVVKCENAMQKSDTEYSTHLKLTLLKFMGFCQ